MAGKRQLWTIGEVAEHLGIAANSADTQLRRWGIAAVARQPGRAGGNLYDAAAVRQANQGRRPGQPGRRPKQA